MTNPDTFDERLGAHGVPEAVDDAWLKASFYEHWDWETVVERSKERPFCGVAASPASMVGWNFVDFAKPKSGSNSAAMARKLTRKEGPKAYEVFGPAMKSDDPLFVDLTLTYYEFRRNYLPSDPLREGRPEGYGFYTDGKQGAVSMGFRRQPFGQPFEHSIGYRDWAAQPLDAGGGGKKTFAGTSEVFLDDEDVDLAYEVLLQFFKPGATPKGMAIPLDSASGPVASLKGPSKLAPIQAVISGADPYHEMLVQREIALAFRTFGCAFFADQASRQQADIPEVWEPDQGIVEVKRRFNMDFYGRLVEVTGALPKHHPGHATHVGSRPRVAEAMEDATTLPLKAAMAYAKARHRKMPALRTRSRAELAELLALQPANLTIEDDESQERTFFPGLQEIVRDVLAYWYGAAVADMLVLALRAPALCYADYYGVGGYHIIGGHPHDPESYTRVGISTSGNTATSLLSLAMNAVGTALRMRASGASREDILATLITTGVVRHPSGYMTWRGMGDNRWYTGPVPLVPSRYFASGGSMKFGPYMVVWLGGRLTVVSDPERLTSAIFNPDNDWDRRGNFLVHEEERLNAHRSGNPSTDLHWGLWEDAIRSSMKQPWHVLRDKWIEIDRRKNAERYEEQLGPLTDADRAYLLHPDGHHYGLYELEDVNPALIGRKTATLGPDVTELIAKQWRRKSAFLGWEHAFIGRDPSRQFDDPVARRGLARWRRKLGIEGYYVTGVTGPYHEVETNWPIHDQKLVYASFLKANSEERKQGE